MPTLYSLTYDLLENQEKYGDFLKSIKNLEKKVKMAEPYVVQAVERLQKFLSTIKEAKQARIQQELQSILDDEMFKRGASVIEFSKGVTIGKTLKVENTKQLAFFQKEKQTLRTLKRYTIDSVKEIPVRDGPDKKICRIIEATRKTKERFTFYDYLDSSTWTEEVEHHRTLDDINDLFPVKGISILEGRVILGNKDYALDITESVRQKAKESYKKLLKVEGKFIGKRGKSE
ncbi:MAG: hypothetical protein ACFFE2_00150 [Candidatus Thorarchaeota archaeon]